MLCESPAVIFCSRYLRACHTILMLLTILINAHSLPPTVPAEVVVARHLHTLVTWHAADATLHGLRPLHMQSAPLPSQVILPSLHRPLHPCLLTHPLSVLQPRLQQLLLGPPCMHAMSRDMHAMSRDMHAMSHDMQAQGNTLTVVL